MSWHYPSSDRIEVSWSPADVDSGGAVGVLFTRHQALQLVDELLDLLDIEHPSRTHGLTGDPMSNADNPVGHTDHADHFDQAVTAMLTAVTAAGRGGQDFAEWLSLVLARVAAMSGGVEAVVAGRPGSWESAMVRDFLRATVGDNDERLVDHLPEGLRPPLGSVALHESADATLWLVTRPWDGTVDQPATVYVRGMALHPDEDLYNDVHAWLIEGADPAADLRWRELGAGDVAEALAHQAHAGADLHDGQAAPGRLLGTFYRDRTNLGAREDGGAYFDVDDRDYLATRPLAVQRYCQTDQAMRLQDVEDQAADAAVAELAELAGELTAADRAAGMLSWSPHEPGEVAVLYATALALARHDDAAFDRARELKAEYDAWRVRWHGLYTDAQPAGADVFGLPPAAPTGRDEPGHDR